jgi:hypothetical protein
VNETYKVDEEEMDDESRSVVAAGLVHFLQTMAACPLQVLTVTSPVLWALDTASVAQLARFTQIRELLLSASWSDERLADWRSPTLFASLTPGCFPCLSVVRLMSASLSAAAVVAVASAAPRLQQFDFTPTQLGVHPSLVCAILGGYCEKIEHIETRMAEDDRDGHRWGNVKARDVADACTAAVDSARRNDGYRPFTQLRYLRVGICSCTAPAIWHALLTLMGAAQHLRYAAELSSNDPLQVCSLASLPH